jgi:membrane associated rhomboid family serine protease
MAYSHYKGSTGGSSWNTGNPLVMLIIVQAMFFILLNFIKSLYTFSSLQEEAFFRNIYHWFLLPADPVKFLGRPWTLATMMFSELKLLMVISNLIWLWTFGYLVQDLLGSDKLFPIYIYSAVCAALVFMLTANLMMGELATSAFFTGIVPAIMGLAIAATMIAPQYRFFPMIGGGIPLWVIALVYILLDVAALSSNLIMLVPHFFGGLTGFLFVFLLRQGNDPGEWMNRLARTINSWLRPGKKKPFSAKTTVFYQQGKRSAFVKTSQVTQQRIDAILDKINQKGYENLTDDEKKFLEKASKENL